MRIALPDMRTRRWEAWIMALAIGATLTGASCARKAPAADAVSAPSQSVETTPGASLESEILDHLPSTSGVTAIGQSDDGTVRVAGTATSAADGTRTLWYETVAAAAYAERSAGKSLVREVTDSTGRLLDEATDRYSPGEVRAFSEITLTEAEFAAGVESRASALGVKLVQATYIDLFGGFGELVIEPADGKTFVEHAGSQLASVLGGIADGQRPYLVTVVDAHESPLMLMAYTPNVGGDLGQGLAWLAPGLTSDAVIGAPVTATDAPTGPS